MERIPFNKPCFVGKEIEYIRAAVQQGHTAGNGPFTKKCEELLSDLLGCPRVLLTTSCTHALEMAAILCEVEPGDEVILPSFTFVSTANAFVLRGARPVFIDIRSDTLNLDEGKLEGLISSRTKAIVPVHYAGIGCEMDALCGIADQHQIPLVEDNAHALFGKYEGRYLGTFGALATLSFHETKNFICGEGGALLINDPRYTPRAEVLREKGTDRTKYFRGEVDKYSWVDLGSSYIPSDILSAFLLAQLEGRDRILRTRKRIYEHYGAELDTWARDNGVRLPLIPTSCESSYHMFQMIMPTLEDRERLINHLDSRGILSVFHYVPLHLSRMGRKFGYREGDYPITEEVGDRLLRLPFYNDLEVFQQDRVCEAIREYRCC